MENTFNLKKIMPIALGVVVFVLAFFATQHFLSSSEEDKALTEAALVEKAAEINQSCPKMVDEEKKLENVMSSPNNNFQFNYTLVNFSSTQASDDMGAIQEDLKSSIMSDLKNNPEFGLFKEKKTTLVYYYSDRDGNAIFDITITPDLYQ